MKPYKSYFHRGQDPLLTEATNKILETGVTFKQLSRDSGVSTSTFSNWKSRKSKRTFTTTLNAALRASDMQLTIAAKNGRGSK